MSVPAVEQVISALKLIQGHDGSDRGPRKMQQLRDNSNYFRRKLKEMNLMVLGDDDSPVMVRSCCAQSLHGTINAHSPSCCSTLARSQAFRAWRWTGVLPSQWWASLPRRS